MKLAAVNEEIVISRPGYTLPSTIVLPASDGTAKTPDDDDQPPTLKRKPN